MNFLENLEAGWLWMIGGVLLLIAEIIAPGFFLLFIGAAAIAAGLFTLLFDLGVAGQLALFAVYAVVAVMIGRKVYANAAVDAGDPMLNDRAARLVGKSVTVIEDVDEHSGRVRLGDSEWSARGGPGSAGERVRITGVEGNCLLVEPDRRLPPA
ncbi:MAG TPA: NfeD family protein [Sphingomicrobium sp.]|nr:NfeD family protein [Sphingomicrobium sp.]